MVQKSSHSFKKYERGQRMLTSVKLPTSGMAYSDGPMPDSFCRLLMNMDITQDYRLRPRGGMQKQSELKLADSPDDINFYEHHTGLMYVEDLANDDAYIRRYILAGPKHTDDEGMQFDQMVLAIEKSDGELIVSTLESTALDGAIIKYRNNKDWSEIHQTTVENATPTGIFATLEGNTYVLTDQGLCRLRAMIDNGVYKHKLEKIEPKEITPVEAVNYGYNMMDDDPYNFTNNVGPSLQLHGVLPYDKQGVLKMKARVGEELTFKLVYDYVSGKSYKVQWEMYELGSSKDPDILAKVADSVTYTNGAEIAWVGQPKYKKFALICKVYDSSNTTEPIKVITLASYYLTEDVHDKSANVAPSNYDLATATGMTVWENKLVLWGVSGAKTSIFVSDINNPAYFPFPQGVHPFKEEVIKVVPFLENAIVFTTNRVVHLSTDTQGNFILKGIQENLNLQPHDADNIIVIKNMVYFKSGSYFYMIVPNTAAGEGALQLAPISRPVEQLLDNFEEAVVEMVDDNYLLSYTLDTADWTLKLQDYYNYLDNNKVHNVYKYKLSTDYEDSLMLEVHLNYDVVARTWTTYVMQTNKNLITPYERTVTESATYFSLFRRGGDVYLQLCKIVRDDAEDTIELESLKKIYNYQTIDTGKMLLGPTHKKRMREIQIEANNISKKDLEFYDVFLMDDEQRNDIFDYNTVHITDKNDPNFGEIYVQKSRIDPKFSYGPSTLGSWSLGNSKFPELTILKMRVQITGKGYYPRLKLMCINEAMYEITGLSWVYRILNAR